MSRDKQIEEMAKQLYGNFGLSMPTARNIATYLTNKKGYRKSEEVASEIFEEIDDLRRYIILNENIALKCKQENGEKNEDYWKGKLSAFKQIRAYIDAELKRQHKEGQK